MLAHPAWTGIGVVVSILALIVTVSDTGEDNKGTKSEVINSQFNVGNIEAKNAQFGNNNTMEIKE
jgi:hypothetical protein